MAINLHIDQLILHGFDDLDRRQFAAALEQELSRLLAEQHGAQIWTGPAYTARVDGGSIDMVPNMGAEALGAQVAQSITDTIQPAESRENPS